MKSKLKVLVITIILLISIGVLYKTVTTKKPPDMQEITRFIYDNEETLDRLVAIAKEDKRFLRLSSSEKIWEETIELDIIGTEVDDEVHNLYTKLVETGLVVGIYESDPNTFGEISPPNFTIEFYKLYKLNHKSYVNAGFVYIEKSENGEKFHYTGTKHISGNWYYYYFPIPESCTQ